MAATQTIPEDLEVQVLKFARANWTPREISSFLSQVRKVSATPADVTALLERNGIVPRPNEERDVQHALMQRLPKWMEELERVRDDSQRLVDALASKLDDPKMLSLHYKVLLLRGRITQLVLSIAARKRVPNVRADELAESLLELAREQGEIARQAKPPPPRPPQPAPPARNAKSVATVTPLPPPKLTPEPKQSRNSVCECGSGKKYKKCCGLAAVKTPS